MTRARATAPDLREPFAGATQARTARAFGALIAERPAAPRVRVVPVAPHVCEEATEDARDAIIGWLRAWEFERDVALRWAAVIAQGLATMPLDVDPREAVQTALYRADQRCAIRAGQRVAPVLRAYVGALEEHARVIRADVMCRGVSRESEREAGRCEAYAESVRRRSEQ